MIKNKTVYRIIPGQGGIEAEEWVKTLHAMYKAYKGKIEWEKETGVHRLTFKNKEGLRVTVFALVVHGEKETWSPQVRKYVTYPYKMVKDIRTGKETDRVEEVLAGNLDLIKA